MKKFVTYSNSYKNICSYQSKSLYKLFGIHTYNSRNNHSDMTCYKCENTHQNYIPSALSLLPSQCLLAHSPIQ